MAFSKKTWKDRISQYINRRLLTDSDGNTQQVTVTRDEGSVTEAGDAFSAANMNDLEDRIDAAFDGLTTYSTSEKVVGKWIDGSALYEQTIEVNNPTSTTVTDYDYFSIAELNVNADIGFFVNGYAIRSDGRRLSLPYNRFYSADNTLIPEVYIDYATGKISVSITKLSSWNVTLNKVAITVRYTKKS